MRETQSKQSPAMLGQFLEHCKYVIVKEYKKGNNIKFRFNIKPEPKNIRYKNLSENAKFDVFALKVLYLMYCSLIIADF